MSTSNTGVPITGEAGSVIALYRLVTLAADGQYDYTGAGGRADGVAMEAAAAAGDAFAMAVPDGRIVKIEASAAISVGDRLEAAASGKVATGANPGVGDYWVGIARTAAGADGDIISMQFLVDQDQVA